jgi:hypothetical protein
VSFQHAAHTTATDHSDIQAKAWARWPKTSFSKIRRRRRKLPAARARPSVFWSRYQGQRLLLTGGQRNTDQGRSLRSILMKTLQQIPSDLSKVLSGSCFVFPLARATALSSKIDWRIDAHELLGVGNSLGLQFITGCSDAHTAHWPSSKNQCPCSKYACPSLTLAKRILVMAC